MPITPLPVFESEADPKARGLTDEEIAEYEGLQPPDTVVVRYGYMRLIGEFPARLDFAPGCGTKFVVKTPRGLEIGEMLTTTCPNAGCGKSMTRHEMLEYIENSGGRQYPFAQDGRIIRVATPDDLNRMAELESRKREFMRRVREVADELSLQMNVIEVEPILGEDVLTVYYMAEERVDFREMVRMLAREFSTRIEMRQVGARDEARLSADYERCGQHCCCRQFLKVLKPVSMKSAKVQKATLDPLKISGRCGRLMCCLRYEDQTYADLKKRLPNKRSRVGTPDGAGIVIDTQILTQLVLVELEHDQNRIAVPVESLMDPDQAPKPGERRPPDDDAFRGLSESEVAERTDDRRRGKRRGRRRRSAAEQQDAYRDASQAEDTSRDHDDSGESVGPSGEAEPSDEAKPKRRKRRRGRRKGKTRGGKGGAPDGSSGAGTPESSGDQKSDGNSGTGRRRGRGRRRRGGRGRRGGGKGAGGGNGDGGDGGGDE